ncbi:hypothetical protein GDO86_008331 [Hymenochirus boettgeri]|uniref:Uncharacterized protein n=1 Tax=Hymenochirus boettgeri TaxID=247094 RepID=A0A8T2J2J6_9PIPI|nr:hypothetical protein GDO86_008331 [Hymenochirus boettgeri]
MGYMDIKNTTMIGPLKTQSGKDVGRRWTQLEPGLAGTTRSRVHAEGRERKKGKKRWETQKSVTYESAIPITNNQIRYSFAAYVYVFIFVLLM